MPLVAHIAATAAHGGGIIFLAYMVKECYDNKI